MSNSTTVASETTSLLPTTSLITSTTTSIPSPSTTIIPSSSSIIPPVTTSSALPISSFTSTTAAAPTTSAIPTTSNIPSVVPTTIITTQITSKDGSTAVITITSTAQVTQSQAASSSSTTSAGSSLANGGGEAATGNLSPGGKIAVAVVVPIAAVALLVIAGIFFWRKRKQRKDAEEERRKEVEDYNYNPNADPMIPDVGTGGSYEMKEDGSSGYRGWGSTTLAGSTGRKASTTMSGGAAGAAYSDINSPIQGNVSDSRSGEPLMSDGSHSPEGEILGAMGPSAAGNRGANVHRGPSNASSSYSAAGRSDGSGGDVGVAYGGTNYYDSYGNSNPYTEGEPKPQELGGQPVIRDNPARRNTRIENPSHYPQQSAGISANF